MNKDKCWTVYMHYNRANGKRYIGITSQPPEIRWGNGYGYLNQVFYNAIQKYGWNGFDHIIIKDKLSEKEAKHLEIELIEKYQTLTTQHGYNVTNGGDGRLGNKILQFSMYGDYIKTYSSVTAASNDTGIANSNISAVCSGKMKHAGGYVWRYISDVKDINNYKNEFDFSVLDVLYPIYLFDLNQNYIRSYSCAIEAHDYNNKIFVSSILDCCRGKYKNACGYIWRFQKDVEDPYNFCNVVIPEKPRKQIIHTICQFDLNGIFIQEFDSPTIAAEYLNCDSHTITYACSGRTQSGAGFMWRYKEDWDGGNIDSYIPNRPKPKTKRVAQIDSSGNIITTYDSIKDASVGTNMNVGKIKDILRNKYTGINKYGFTFKYTGEIA